MQTGRKIKYEQLKHKRFRRIKRATHLSLLMSIFFLLLYGLNAWSTDTFSYFTSSATMNGEEKNATMDELVQIQESTESFGKCGVTHKVTVTNIFDYRVDLSINGGQDITSLEPGETKLYENNITGENACGPGVLSYQIVGYNYYFEYDVNQSVPDRTPPKEEEDKEKNKDCPEPSNNGQGKPNDNGNGKKCGHTDTEGTKEVGNGNGKGKDEENDNENGKGKNKDKANDATESQPSTELENPIPPAVEPKKEQPAEKVEEDPAPVAPTEPAPESTEEVTQES
ncbi:hypothetical protein [Bacillus sp. CGMCC 1.16541]|uniref:hypothetical protein n=1 Tax=Bacillus sp. CGMCC 1.16541 TaxID=2185143 RepID=UPI0013A5614D|nr:hypothetical protein [Bacillus sp. CGMCC 1.16541]